MRPWIGGLLLAAGTVVASVAAARGERPWIDVPLEEVVVGSPDSVLAEDLTVELVNTDSTSVTVEAGRAGSVVTPNDVELARGADHASLRLSRLPRETETVELADLKQKGRVLADGVYTDAESGALLDPVDGAARRAAVADARERVERLEYAADDAEGGREFWLVDGAPTTEAPESGAAPATAEALRDALEAARAELAALPRTTEVAKPGAFVDEPLFEKLEALGLERAEVRLSMEWGVDVWGGLPWFVLGVILMVVGVVLLRTGPVAASEVARGERGTEVGGAFERLLVDTRALHAERGALGVELIVERTTPLHHLAYQVVESRASLRARLGATAFAEFMGDFSTGERGLNRAWSAAVDGYDEEARAALEDALPALERAAERLAQGGPK